MPPLPPFWTHRPTHSLPLKDWAQFSLGLRPVNNFLWRLQRLQTISTTGVGGWGAGPTHPSPLKGALGLGSSTKGQLWWTGGSTRGGVSRGPSVLSDVSDVVGWFTWRLLNEPSSTPPPPLPPLCNLPPLAIPPPQGDCHFHVFLVNIYCAGLCCPSALHMALHFCPITSN